LSTSLVPASLPASSGLHSSSEFSEEELPRGGHGPTLRGILLGPFRTERCEKGDAGMKITGRLAPLIAAVEAAEEGRRLAHKDVRESVLELGSLMDERTRLRAVAQAAAESGAVGSKDLDRALTTLLKEERRTRDELALARELLSDAELVLARSRKALEVALRG